MVKATPAREKDLLSSENVTDDYDYLKTIIKLAKRNGWDLESLDLIPKDVRLTEAERLTRKEILERDRLVKRVFQRYGKVLTPSVPTDLEKSIRLREPSTWLPWEKEVMEKVRSWEEQVARIKPEFLNELRHAILNFPALGKD